MSDAPGLNPPFEEAASVQQARAHAKKLASSGLPLLITGEVGTGRRTLAGAVAELRGDADILVAFNGFEGVPDDLRTLVAANNETPTALIHHLGTLDRQGQVEIAGYMRGRCAHVVATSQPDDAHNLEGDLRAALESTAITLPALRDRGTDALEWARHFVRRAAAELGRKALRLAADAERAVLAHRWPGNLAELDSVIRKAVLLVEGSEITTTDLGFGEELKIQPLREAEAEFRMAYVAKVLAHFEGNRTQAARALGIDPRTMFRYLEKAKKGS